LPSAVSSHAGGPWHHRQRLVAGALHRGERGRQLDGGQRVALGQLDAAAQRVVGHGHRRPHDRAQRHRPERLERDGLRHQVVERRGFVGLAGGDGEHGIGAEPADGEREDVGGGPVEEVGVVDGQHQGAAGRDPGEHPEGGQADGDGVGLLPAQGQGAAQLGGEVAGQLVELVVEGLQHGEQGREAELDVGGPPLGGEDGEALLGGVRPQVVEEHRLAHPDRPVDAHDRSPAGGGGHRGPLEAGELLRPGGPSRVGSGHRARGVPWCAIPCRPVARKVEASPEGPGARRAPRRRRAAVGWGRA
jgi:hypothetical protein